MRSDEIYIIGNSYSCLMLATLVSNKKVNLISDYNFLGGIFNGIDTDLGHFDLGMNYVEIFNDKNQDISKYNPNIRNDFLNYTYHSNKFLTVNYKLDKVPIGLSIVNGVFYDDYFIFDKLNFLSKIPENQKKIILSQLNFSNENHPNQKYTDPDYLSYSYEYICKKLYGPFFYENYLEPFLLKVLNCKGSEIPALFHRLAWMPLFYPETIKDAINGIFFEPKNCFYYPKGHDFNYLVNKLKDKIKRAPNIKILSNKVNLDLKNRLVVEGEDINPQNVFLGTNISKLLKRDHSQKASLIFVFAKIDSDNLKRLFSVVNVLDKCTPIYRVTNQNFNSKNCKSYKFCFEINKDYLHDYFNESDIIKLVNGFLVQYQITKKILSKNFINIKYFNEIIELPTFKNFSNFNLNKIKLNAFNLLSPSISFFSNSLNDQIIESIKVSKKINHD